MKRFLQKKQNEIKKMRNEENKLKRCVILKKHQLNQLTQKMLNYKNAKLANKKQNQNQLHVQDVKRISQIYVLRAAKNKKANVRNAGMKWGNIPKKNTGNARYVMKK